MVRNKSNFEILSPRSIGRRSLEKDVVYFEKRFEKIQFSELSDIRTNSLRCS